MESRVHRCRANIESCVMHGARRSMADSRQSMEAALLRRLERS